MPSVAATAVAVKVGCSRRRLKMLSGVFGSVFGSVFIGVFIGVFAWMLCKYPSAKANSVHRPLPSKRTFGTGVPASRQAVKIRSMPQPQASISPARKKALAISGLYITTNYQRGASGRRGNSRSKGGLPWRVSDAHMPRNALLTLSSFVVIVATRDGGNTACPRRKAYPKTQ